MTAAEDASTNERLREFRRSRAGRTVGFVGIGSRAIVYGTLAGLVLAVAFGDKHSNTDQGSAIATLGENAVGQALLVLLVLGVACFALWRWSEAWLGPAGGGEPTKGDRVSAFVEGAAYLPFAYFAISVLAGDSAKADQGRNYRSLSGRILQHGAGQVLVGAVGVGVIVLGGYFVYMGVRRTFEDDLTFPPDRPEVRHTVLGLGTVGNVGRGLIFAMAGVLVVYAAVTTSPREAGGLDSALDTLRRQMFGTWLLVLAALGFAAFAVFAFCEAVYRKR